MAACESRGTFCQGKRKDRKPKGTDKEPAKHNSRKKGLSRHCKKGFENASEAIVKPEGRPSWGPRGGGNINYEDDARGVGVNRLSGSAGNQTLPHFLLEKLKGDAARHDSLLLGVRRKDQAKRD